MRRIAVNRERLEQARASFIHPENRDMDLNLFGEALLELADGTRSGNSFITDHDRGIIEAILDILRSLKGSRFFDETYLGHMLSETSIPGLIGYIAALRIGSNTVAREVSELESQLEPPVIRWFSNLIGYDSDQSSGTVTTGGTLANTTALWVAREVFTKENPNFQGRYVVLGNPFAHYSVRKSLWMLGGPRNNIDFQGLPTQEMKIDPLALEEEIEKITEINRTASPESQIGIVAILSIAGETETGLVDPLQDIGKIAQRHGIYHHIDGAYGLPYKLSAAADLFQGTELAQSVSIDSHKALYTPYSAGFVLFQDVNDHASISLTARDAPYVFKNNEISLGQKRIEGSMGAGPILSTLAVINSLGEEGLGAIYDHTLENIDCLYQRLESSDILYPIHKPDLNVLCFSIRPEFLHRIGVCTNEELLELIEVSRKKLDSENPYGREFFFSSTMLPVDSSVETFEPAANVQPVYRAVLMHPRTSALEIEEAVNSLEMILLETIR